MRFPRKGAPGRLVTTALVLAAGLVARAASRAELFANNLVETLDAHQGDFMCKLTQHADYFAGEGSAGRRLRTVGVEGSQERPHNAMEHCSRSPFGWADAPWEELRAWPKATRCSSPSRVMRQLRTAVTSLGWSAQRVSALWPHLLAMASAGFDDAPVIAEAIRPGRLAACNALPAEHRADAAAKLQAAVDLAWLLRTAAEQDGPLADALRDRFGGMELAQAVEMWTLLDGQSVQCGRPGHDLHPDDRRAWEAIFARWLQGDPDVGEVLRKGQGPGPEFEADVAAAAARAPGPFSGPGRANVTVQAPEGGAAPQPAAPATTTAGAGAAWPAATLTPPASSAPSADDSSEELEPARRDALELEHELALQDADDDQDEADEWHTVWLDDEAADGATHRPTGSPAHSQTAPEPSASASPAASSSPAAMRPSRPGTQYGNSDVPDAVADAATTLLAISRVARADPCASPFVTCALLRPPDDPAGAPDLRIVGVDLSQTTALLERGQLPVEFALLSSLRHLDIVATRGAFVCAPGNEAVLRALPLATLSASVHLRAGPLGPAVHPDCVGLDESADELRRAACAAVTAAASVRLRDSTLGRSLRGLSLDIEQPPVRPLFGARPGPSLLEAFVSLAKTFAAPPPAEAGEPPAPPGASASSEKWHSDPVEARRQVIDSIATLNEAERAAAGPAVLAAIGAAPELALPLAPVCRDEGAHAASEAEFFRVAGLREAAGRAVPAASARVRLFGHSIQWPAELAWLCELGSLRRLVLPMGAAGLPACLASGAPQLMNIEARGALFSLVEPETWAPPSDAEDGPASGRALPSSLSGLRRMVSFTAFQQSTSQCGPDPEQCAPLFELLEEGAHPETMSEYQITMGLWRCGSGGSWAPSIGDRSQPWWGWRRLERFWVDGNRFQGSLPADIGQLWPRMRTLDLYSNDIEGPVPGTIADMADLLQLQLQHNRFAGGPQRDGGPVLHRSIQPDLARVDLRLNRGLTGPQMASGGRFWGPGANTTKSVDIQLATHSARVHPVLYRKAQQLQAVAPGSSAEMAAHEAAASYTSPLVHADAHDTQPAGPPGIVPQVAVHGSAPSAVSRAAEIMELKQPAQVIGVQESTPVAWRNDGSALAYVSGNHSIFILHPDSSPAGAMQVARVLNGHDSPVRALVFHPTDPDVLVSGGADGIFVWSLRAGRPTKVIRSEANVSAEFPAHESDVEVLVFAFKNNLISGSKDCNIKVWDADRGYTLLETITGHKAAVLSLKVHERTQRLASAGRDSGIKVWDISTLAPEWRARRADDRGIQCQLMGNLDGHRGDVVTLTWRPDGTGLFSGARDNTWRMWHVPTYSEVRVVEDASKGMDGSHRGDVRRIVGLPGGRTAVTASLDGNVMLWELDPEDGSNSLVSAAMASSEQLADAGSPGGAVAASAAGAAGAGPSAGGDAAAADDGATSISGGGGAGAWDSGTAAILEQIMGGDTAGGDAAAAVVASASDRILGQTQLVSPAVGIFHMELCPANMRIAISTTANTVIIYQFNPTAAGLLGYDPRDPSAERTHRLILPRLQAFHGHSHTVHEVELLGAGTDDRLVATCSADNTVAVYDAATTARLMSLDFTASALCLALARTRDAGPLLMVGGSDYVIRAYCADHERHAAHERQLASGLRSAQSAVPPSAFEAARYEGHSGRVLTLAVHSNGTMMASGASDFTVMLWDLTKPKPVLPTPGGPARTGTPVGRPLARVDAHMGLTLSLAFCDAAFNGGDMLASGGNDHAVKVWQVTSGTLGGKTLTEKWTGRDDGDDVRGGHRGPGSLAAVGPQPHRAAVSAVRWGHGPSAGLVFTAGWDHVISVWDANSASGSATRLPLASRQLHSARITDMDVSSNGAFVVTVSADFTARQWTATKDLRAVARFPCSALDGGMTSVAAGYRRFFCASDNGQIRVFPLYSPEDKAAAASFTSAVDTAQLAEAEGAAGMPTAAGAGKRSTGADGSVHATNPAAGHSTAAAASAAGAFST
ncbi:hypothetical protein FNF29_02027 [Cafeteria roenbergensis]|uniref:Origin recognition complex-associated protein n=1 Tax=Cafeteria roenbergensis TaxID=33653 RepID=A0A5A8CP65_CAFRO|nr:hypothetical protein FNF29_02027 [Cafeteria roenbergensis]|eukprot:KAA0154886.1 hypothetical protein FNF29_02027 [Cafeteria roenbergensis]